MIPYIKKIWKAHSQLKMPLLNSHYLEWILSTGQYKLPGKVKSMKFFYSLVIFEHLKFKTNFYFWNVMASSFLKIWSALMCGWLYPKKWDKLNCKNYSHFTGWGVVFAFW